MILVKKSLDLYGKNGIIADGKAELCGGRVPVFWAASAPIKKGPDRGQVQLSFASVILS